MRPLVRMRNALDEAKIYHARLVGMEFTFESDSGSHGSGFWGVVTGAGWSREGGFQLFVSIPEFLGRPLKYITFIQTGDGLVSHAHIEADDTEFKQKFSELGEDDFEERRRLLQEFDASQYIRGSLVIVKN